jgi:hypothetical protein
MKTVNNRVSKSVIHYVMLGPQAVERRLVELDSELKRCKNRLTSLMSARLHLNSWGLGRFLSRIVRRFRAGVGRTARQVNAERRALQALLGGSTRTWETTKPGPTPLI